MPSVSSDREQNVVAALVAWVENGTAPEQIIATKYKNNNVTEGIELTRPLCKVGRPVFSFQSTTELDYSFPPPQSIFKEIAISPLHGSVLE